MRTLALLLIALSTSGCGALIDAGFRELDDHGSHARYRHQSFGAHFADALTEEDCRPRRRDCDREEVEVRVYVDHHHRR